MGVLPWWTIGSPLGKKVAINQFDAYINRGVNNSNAKGIGKRLEARQAASIKGRAGGNNSSPVRSYNTAGAPVPGMDTTSRGSGLTPGQEKTAAEKKKASKAMSDVTPENIDKQPIDRLKLEYSNLTSEIYEESTFKKEFNKEWNTGVRNRTEADALRAEIRKLQGWE